MTVSPDVFQVVLCSLAAGTEYNITVAAATSKGYGAVATIRTWTEIGIPDKPPKPVVNSTGPDTITILIRPAVLTSGPLSAYFIVVSTPADDRRRRSARRVRRSLPDPVVHIPLPGVTVARLAADNVRLARYFVVGDGRTYGGYENSALSADIRYTIYYVVASSVDGQTKMNFAATDNPVAPSTGFWTTTAATLQEGLSTGIIIAIVLAALLLFAILVTVVLLLIRYCCCKDQPGPSPSPRPAGSTLNTSWLKYYTGIRLWRYCLSIVTNQSISKS